ncbi:hypothetical protein ABVT39_021630 [Epinephelus coioides]
MESTIGNACFELIERIAQSKLYIVFSLDHVLICEIVFLWYHLNIIAILHIRNLSQSIFPGLWHETTGLEIQGFPRQPYGNDCGIFMLMVDMPALRKWWCVMLMENFELGRAVLQDEVPPVFHLKKRKMDDITEVSDFSPIGRRGHVILVDVLEKAGSLEHWNEQSWDLSSPGDLELVDVEDDDHDESCSSLPVQVGSSETDSKQSADSSESRKSQAQKIVSKELGDILDILLDDASDTERDVLLRDTYQESDSVVSDISESAGAAVRADKPKITLLLAKQYAKQLIHRAARNLKKIFSPNSKVKSRESLQSFADSVCELLRPEGGEKHPADEERQLENLQHIAEGRDLVFTEALRSLLSEYTIDGMTPESFCQLGPFRNTQAIRRATCRTVWRFQVLLRWWLTYQAGIHCDNVMTALNATEPTSPAPTVTVPETGAEPVLHLAPDQDSEIKQTLSTFERLDKAVFKDLCKSWGCAELVLLRMNRGEQEIDHIASTFKHHLMKPPKQQSAICRLFSSLGQAISKPFTSTWARVAPI